MKVNSISNQKSFLNSFRSNPPLDNKGVIDMALSELRNIKFDSNDILYVKSLGANPPFLSGEDAFNFIKDNNIKIAYSKLEPYDTHACFSHGDNTIYINERYKNLSDFSGILMISEAIFHEAGHAKDKDRESSLQEEFDCLSLNVLSHMYYNKKYDNPFSRETSTLYLDGVGIYRDLFFRFDLDKAELKQRMKEKYGFLPQESPKHPMSEFVRSIGSEERIRTNL